MHFVFCENRWSFQSLTVFAKTSMLDVWLGPEYASDFLFKKNFFAAIGNHCSIHSTTFVNKWTVQLTN